MKLLRIGETGSEKPALIDNENKYRDLSSVIKDLNPDTLNFETLEKIKNIDASKLPEWTQISELVHVYRHHQNLLELV